MVRIHQGALQNAAQESSAMVAGWQITSGTPGALLAGEQRCNHPPIGGCMTEKVRETK